MEIFAADGNYAIAIAIAILGGFGAAFGAIMAAYLQRRTAERLKGDWHELDTGHYPMLSQPEELTRLLLARVS